MPARILNGIAIRDQIYAELKQEIAALSAAGIRPGLAAVLVGENPASQIYVRSKIAACEQLGLGSWQHTPPATVTTDEMLALVARAERARRRGRNPGAASSAAAGGHEARARSCGPGEGRGRVSSGESRAAGFGPRGTRGVHARRVHGNSAAQRHSAGGSRTPWSWGAATLSESRWRCC